jgi:hypothetical protein
MAAGSLIHGTNKNPEPVSLGLDLGRPFPDQRPAPIFFSLPRARRQRHDSTAAHPPDFSNSARQHLIPKSPSPTASSCKKGSTEGVLTVEFKAQVIGDDVREIRRTAPSSVRNCLPQGTPDCPTTPRTRHQQPHRAPGLDQKSLSVSHGRIRQCRRSLLSAHPDTTLEVGIVSVVMKREGRGSCGR